MESAMEEAAEARADRHPFESYEDILERDTRPVPEHLRQGPTRDLGDEGVPVTNYFDPDFFAKEVRHVWMRVWQWACREEEIPDAGDVFVYENVGKSVLVTRQQDGALKGEACRVGHDDPQLAQLLIQVASAVPAQASDRWRFVIQSDDSAIASAAQRADRRDIVSVVPGPIADDMLMTSDVLVLRHGRHDDIANAASNRGAVAVIVGHPVAARVPQRFDGVRLASADVSSVLVAIESARGPSDAAVRSAPEVRLNGDQVVATVRSAGAA